MRHLKSFLMFSLFWITLQSAYGADPASSPAANPSAAPSPSGEDAAEQVQVDKIKEKYWARGDETETSVVQDRMYSKNHKVEFGLFAANVDGDPFLSTHSLGVSLGYNFTEYFAVRALGWKNWNSSSSALTTLQNQTGTTANTNPAQYFYGTEAVGSVMYGKLSLLGNAIIYFDAHVTGGLGNTKTASGNDFTQYIGIGQSIYVTRSMALNLDYRFMHYGETVIGQNTNNFGQDLGNRSNTSGLVSVGVTFLVDLFHDSSK
jgi:outer membrane beta-barrel protein